MFYCKPKAWDLIFGINVFIWSQHGTKPMETLGRGGGSRETYITKKIKIRTKADIRRKKTYKYGFKDREEERERKNNFGLIEKEIETQREG